MVQKLLRYTEWSVLLRSSRHETREMEVMFALSANHILRPSLNESKKFFKSFATALLVGPRPVEYLYTHTSIYIEQLPRARRSIVQQTPAGRRAPARSRVHRGLPIDQQVGPSPVESRTSRDTRQSGNGLCLRVWLRICKIPL